MAELALNINTNGKSELQNVVLGGTGCIDVDTTGLPSSVSFSVTGTGSDYIDFIFKAIDGARETYTKTINVTVEEAPAVWSFTLDDGTVLENGGSYEFNSGDIITLIIE